MSLTRSTPGALRRSSISFMSGHGAYPDDRNSRQPYEIDLAARHYAIEERSLSQSERRYSRIRFEEKLQFIKSLNARTGQIEAADVMLFYCYRLGGDGVEFLVMAENYPAIATADF